MRTVRHRPIVIMGPRISVRHTSRSSPAPEWPSAGETLHFRALRQCQGILDIDPEITHGALNFCVPKQYLYRSEIAGLFVNQSSLGPP